MLLSVAITALLVGSFFQLPAQGSGNFEYDESLFCTHDPSVEAFAVSFFSAMLVEHGQKVVFSIQVNGTLAANSEYHIVKQILENAGMCSAEWVAYTASLPFRSDDTVHLEGYLQKTAHSLGLYLLNQGLLDCSNSISLSLDYFALVRKAFQGLDEKVFESYQWGVLKGLLYLISEHDMNLEDAANDLAYAFYKEVKSSHKGDCKKSDSK